MELLKKLILNNNKSKVLVDQVVFSGNSFIVTILMARILSPRDFGLYAAIILFIYLIVSIMNAIVMQPLQVTLSQFTYVSSYITFSFWVQLILLGIISLIVSVFLNLDISFLTQYSQLGLGIVILTFGFVMHDYFRKLFLAELNINQALIIDVITTCAHVSVLLIVLNESSFLLSDILIMLGLGYVPSFLIAVFFIKPVFIDFTKWESYLLIHYRQSKWLLMTALVQWWSTNLFIVASGIFLGIVALGAFRLVQSLFGVLNMLLQTFENYALPQTSRLLFSSMEEARAYLKKIGIKTSLFFGLVLLTILIFAKPIIVLAGGEHYADYAFVVRGMAILYAVIFIGYPTRMAIRALVLNKHFFIAYVLSLLFSLFSFSFLLNKWNLMGAILGLIISQIILISYWQIILIKKNFLLWK